MLIDSRGRLFGRVNLFDALVLGFLLALLPTAYATYLLFRPAAPQIDTVDRVEITREERRLAGGSRISAKLKVRGSGFNPMLRAVLDTTPAIGFVFENPNSADVIAGDLPPGTYDLVLFDGVHEVARADDAVIIEGAPEHRIRAVGYLVDLSPAAAAAIVAGDAYPKGNPRMRVIAVGAPRTSHTRIHVGGGIADLAVTGRLERPAAMSLTCDPYPADEACAVAGVSIAGEAPIVPLPMPQPVRFVITEVLPDVPAQRATAVLRLTGAAVSGVVVGAHDALLDDRAAVVTQVRRGIAADSGWTDLVVDLGVDESREGWRYRGKLVRAGAVLELDLPAASVRGTVQSLTLRSPDEESR